MLTLPIFKPYHFWLETEHFTKYYNSRFCLSGVLLQQSWRNSFHHWLQVTALADGTAILHWIVLPLGFLGAFFLSAHGDWVLCNGQKPWVPPEIIRFASEVPLFGDQTRLCYGFSLGGLGAVFFFFFFKYFLCYLAWKYHQVTSSCVPCLCASTW